MGYWTEARFVGGIIFGVPISLAGLWEYRVYVEKKRLNERKAQFTGDTPFYGKRWGYTTDYMIDQSLRTGDLIFLSYTPKNLHFPQAILKRISSKFSKTVWDDVYLVVQKFGELKYLIGLNPKGGFELELYADKIADSFASTVTVRRLQCSDEIRQRLVTTLTELSVEAENWRSSSLARPLSLYRRTQGIFDSQWDWCTNMIQLNRNIKIFDVNILRLKSLLNDFDEYMNTTKGASMTSSDKTLRISVESLIKEYQASRDDLVSFHESNPQSNDAPLHQSSSEQSQSSPLTTSSWADYSLQGLNKMEQILNGTPSINQSDKTGNEADQPWWLTLRVKGFLLDQISRAKSVCQKTPFSSAQLAAAIYQSTGLLPFNPPSSEWTIEDLYVTEELLNPADPIPERSGALAAGPLLSRPYHVREEAPDEYSLKMAKWNNLYQYRTRPTLR